MGKVLLVEPHAALQRALSLVFFPEHQVRIEEKLTPSLITDAGGEYQLLVVDVAALRENGHWSQDLSRAIKRSKLPLLWLDVNESAPPPDRARLVVVRKPLVRGAFQAALAALFSGKAASGTEKRKHPAVVGKEETTTEQAAFDFIDLVDVVEEGRPRKRKSGKQAK
jgi:hypothetical protein